MKKFLIFFLLMCGGCSAPDNHVRSRAEIDSTVWRMNRQLNNYFMAHSIDSADLLLTQMADTVAQVRDNKLSLHWLMGKAQNFRYYKQWDSLQVYHAKILSLLPSAEITPKDRLNYYIVYNGHLKDMGQLDSALTIAHEANLLAGQIQSNRLTQTNLDLANIYVALKDWPNVKKYAFQAWQHADQEPELRGFIVDALVSYYDEKNRTDSAIYFLNHSDRDSFWANRPLFHAEDLQAMGAYLVTKGRIQEGLDKTLESVKIYKDHGQKPVITLLNLAEIYSMMGKFPEALTTLDSAQTYAAQSGDLRATRLTWETTSLVHAMVPDYSKAYAALDSAYKTYAVERDSSLLRYGREMESRYAGKEKDMRIASLAFANQVSKKVQRQQRVIIISMVVATLALILAAFLFWRRRKLAHLLQESIMQQRVLQSQMQPHFVANILSVLKGVVRSGNLQKSIALINQFGRVAEQNLRNAQVQLVSVTDELKAVENYLSLQKLQQDGAFDFTIEASPELDADQLRMPPMLLQPFVENALIHGISGLDYPGHILVQIASVGPALRCIIEDNGRGMQPVTDRRDNRMHATEIARERLAHLQRQTGKTARLRIIDKHQNNEGTGVRVEIEVPWQIGGAAAV